MSELDGFRLRATGGVTRRANSVWSSAQPGSCPLAERIARAEAFYAERGIPCRFQITPQSEGGLDQALLERGYVVEAPVSIQVAAVEQVAAHEPDPRAEVTAMLTERWFDVSAHKGRFRGVESTYRGLLERIGTGARFALATVDGEPGAVGLGVLRGDWCGIFSMLTLEGYRRRGLGGAVLTALSHAARDGGASRLYLQVERDNAAALALYRGYGFEERYGYHYRVRG